MKSTAALEVHTRLAARYGRLGWWPADSPFEVMIGAILTQNTAWSNVERALARLRERIGFDAQAILAADPAELAEAIRPSGYFNLKARRLRALCGYYLDAGGHRGLARLATAELRAGLLGVNGVGPETADDMVLYAFDRPVFVIDAYTRRIFSRLGLLDAAAPYETLRAAFEEALPADVALFKQYHGLLVEHAKQACRKRPLCAGCCLILSCSTVRAAPVVERLSTDTGRHAQSR